MSIALVLFLLGSISYAMVSIFRSARGVREGVVMLVELKDGLSVEQRDSLSNQIAQNSIVADIAFCSKEEKIADSEFRRAFDVNIEQVIGKNPLPDSFDITLSAEAADSVALATFVEQVSALKEVSYISYPESMLESVHSVLDTMQYLLILFGGAMLLVSIVLLNNTIRLAIFSRRYLINTLKLVGATKGYIMRPFLATAAKQGLWAGLVASLLFVGSLASLSGAMPEIIATAELIKIAIVVGTMILTGLVISLLFTTFAVGKFVNMKSNKIYLY